MRLALDGDTVPEHPYGCASPPDSGRDGGGTVCRKGIDDA